ncbi:MAG: MBL fold metallo-hydrolase, partial [Acidobacteriota bacterium]
MKTKPTLGISATSTALLLSLFLPTVTIAASASQQATGINQNFVDPEVARERQNQHNNFFLGPEGEGDSLGQILNLQTSDYALAERPSGLDYDVYSAIGYGLATSMMVVGPERDASGNRKVVIIDTLEDFGAGELVAQDYLALYNATYKPAEGLTKLPIDAIIYTHNHIDHTGGVLGYLSMADQEVCPAQDP